MFNQKNKIILGGLDKGHVAWKNFTLVESSYNHPIINAFLEMLVESFFQSLIRGYIKIYPYCECSNSSVNKYPEISDLTYTKMQKSKARLRSLFFLFQALKRFPSLKKNHERKKVISKTFLELKQEANDKNSITNFTIQNNDFLRFLENNTRKNTKFKINNQYICTTNAEVLQKKEIQMIGNLIQFLPQKIESFTIDEKEFKISKTNKVECFLFTIWLSCQKFDLYDQLVNEENEIYKRIIKIIDKINEKNWTQAIYLWLEYSENLQNSTLKKINIDCSSNQFMKIMKKFQSYNILKICNLCQNQNTNKTFGNEFNFEDGSCVFVDPDPEKCRICNGHLMIHEINFCSSKPYWAFAEFKIKCNYLNVQIKIKIGNISYELICCIIEDNDKFFKGLYYINEAFYLFDNSKPNIIKRLNDQNVESNVVSAIYLIKS
jgi:hypothetical protein